MQLLMAGLSTHLRNELVTYQVPAKTSRLDDIFCNSFELIWNEIPGGLTKTMLTGIAGQGYLMHIISCFIHLLRIQFIKLNNFRPFETHTHRKLVKSFELLNWIVDNKYLSNTSLGESMLLFQFSQSKFSVDLLSRILPSGSYSTVRRTIASLNQGEKPLPKNDILIGIF